MEYNEFKKEFYKLVLVFDKKMTEKDYLIYYDLLKDLDIEFISKKINKLIFSNNNFPTIREIRKEETEKIRRTS